MKKPIKLLRLVLLAAIAAVAVALWPTFSSISARDIVNFTPQKPILAAIVLVAIFCIKNIFMVIPLAVLYVAAGLLFPTKWAILVVYTGLACEMSIGYCVGKRTGAERVNDLIRKRRKVGAFFDLLGRNDMVSCFLARLLPLPLPLDIVSLFFGAIGVPFQTYILFSLLGISSKMIPAVIAGRAVSNPLSAEFIVPFALSLGVSGLALLIHVQMCKRRK